MVIHAKKDVSLEPPFQTELLQCTEGVNGVEPLIPILPATYRDRQYAVRLVSADIREFLMTELDVHRLNDIHSWLWLVGLPSHPRPLHYQRLKKRDIIITEQLDLHLVWRPSRIFIKPLPRYLLSAHFWKTQLCPDEDLYCTALGFLLSYVALIEREVDFQIAVSNGLIPSEITWPGWLLVAEEVVQVSARTNSFMSNSSMPSSSSSSDPHVPVNERFFYGELRLGRLNWIYRLVCGRPRGYLSDCTTYGAFARDNINSLITLFAYTTIVLSAMQVGLATQWLVDDYAFGMASYVFSIFSIVAPLLAIAAVLSVIMTLFTINLLRTLRIRRKRRLQGAGV